MRIPALVILAISSVVMTASARAQTYNPRYPICMQVVANFGGTSFDCRFTSMAQCQASASGLPAQCLVNPFFARGRDRPASAQ